MSQHIKKKPYPKYKFRNVYLQFKHKEEQQNFKNISDHVDLLESTIKDATEAIPILEMKIEHCKKIIETKQRKFYKIRLIQQTIIQDKKVGDNGRFN